MAKVKETTEKINIDPHGGFTPINQPPGAGNVSPRRPPPPGAAAGLSSTPGAIGGSPSQSPTPTPTSTAGQKLNRKNRPEPLNMGVKANLLIMEIAQLFMSMLHAWGLDPDLDKLCLNKLGGRFKYCETISIFSMKTDYSYW